MPTDLDPIAVLRRTDPAATAAIPERPPLDELAARPAALDGPGTAGRRSRPALLAAATVLVAVLAAGVAVAVSRPADVDPGPADTTASTASTAPLAPRGSPPPAPLALTGREPARPALLALAERAATDGEPAGFEPGGIVYTRTVGWQPVNQPDGGPVRGVQIESWSEPGAPLAWSEADAPSVLPGGEVDLDLPLPDTTGALRTTSSTLPEDEVDPTDVDAVLALLGVQPGDEADPGAVLVSAGIALSTAPGGWARAGVLRALAAVEGIEHRGPVGDRAGRDGIAFSAPVEGNGWAREVVLVVDAAGVPLTAENVLLDARRGAPIEVPVVTNSQTLLEADHVVEAGDRPG